jgi:DUF1009 family protein
VRTAGLNGIAAMTGYVLAASRLDLIQQADRSFAFVTGVPGAADAAAASDLAVEPVVFGRYRLARAETKADVTRGVNIMATLAGFNTGSALVIVNGRVLSVGTFEPPDMVLERAKAMRRKKRKRAGVVIIGPREALTEDIVKAAADVNLSGVIVTFGSAERPPHKGPVVALADKLGLLIAGAGIP